MHPHSLTGIFASSNQETIRKNAMLGGASAPMSRVLELLPGLEYDLCVLTADYRGKTFGSFDPALAGMARLGEALNGPVFGVLGNHDTIRMVPALEAMGIRMLLNENVVIERGGQRIHLAGIDDAHFYRVDNIEKAADTIPHEEFSILLSHTCLTRQKFTGRPRMPDLICC